MTASAEIVQFQRKQEAKFICSACGADRACDCNAPAVEKLAGIREYERQKKRRQREKNKKNKSGVPGTAEEFTVEDDLAVDEYREAFLLRAADAMSFAIYSGEIDREIIAAARRVAAKWEVFTQTLEARHGKAT